MARVPVVKKDMDGETGLDREEGRVILSATFYLRDYFYFYSTMDDGSWTDGWNSIELGWEGEDRRVYSSKGNGFVRVVHPPHMHQLCD